MDGSSITISLGLLIRARPMASICCSPPESVPARCPLQTGRLEFYSLLSADMQKPKLKLVGSTEANSLEGKISNESPVGKALMGAHTGDIVEVELPSGIMKYKVLEIQRNI